jgi:parvulin-like peptidyl-prolyl isomerase
MIRFVFVVVIAACSGAPGGPSMNNKMGGGDLPKPVSPVVSSSILEREPNTNTAQVRHILISWKDLAEEFSGHQDKRAAARTKSDAETVIKSLVGQLKAGAEFDVLMKEHSEDAGSAKSSMMMKVTPDAQLVIEFKQLALRLAIGEYGVCESQYGFHIIKRLE